jgi:hypothetical protein
MAQTVNLFRITAKGPQKWQVSDGFIPQLQGFTGNMLYLLLQQIRYYDDEQTMI